MGTKTAFQYYIWNVEKIRKKKIKVRAVHQTFGVEVIAPSMGQHNYKIVQGINTTSNRTSLVLQFYYTTRIRIILDKIKIIKKSDLIIIHNNQYISFVLTTHGSGFAPDKDEIALSFINAVICHYSFLMDPISIGIFRSFIDPIRLLLFLFLLLRGQQIHQHGRICS